MTFEKIGSKGTWTTKLLNIMSPGRLGNGSYQTTDDCANEAGLSTDGAGCLSAPKAPAVEQVLPTPIIPCRILDEISSFLVCLCIRKPSSHKVASVRYIEYQREGTVVNPAELNRHLGCLALIKHLQAEQVRPALSDLGLLIPDSFFPRRCSAVIKRRPARMFLAVLGPLGRLVTFGSTPEYWQSTCSSNTQPKQTKTEEQNSYILPVEALTCPLEALRRSPELAWSSTHTRHWSASRRSLFQTRQVFNWQAYSHISGDCFGIRLCCTWM